MRTKPEGKAAGKALSALSKRFAAMGLRPAREVMERVKAVPTRFVELDFATRVGGWPIQRACVVHGPSNEGKSALAIGLCGSFVEAGGLAKYDDAERTTTPEWCRMLLGAETAGSDRFLAAKPPTYEACVDQSREFHRGVAAAREAGEIPEEASAIQVVDSLRKLVPEDIIAKIKKEGAAGKGSVDGMGGRAAQIRAALNAAWLDELIPLVDDCRTAWLAIVRESEDPDADFWAKKFGNDYKVQGGKAVVYDSALRCRVERVGYTTIEKDGKKIVVGERHRVTILKTKVAGKEGRASIAYFHTSNGILCPEGFDRARDVAELATRFGIVDSGSGGTRWKGQRWASMERFIAALNEADGERETLEAECRARFVEEAPEEPPAAAGEE